MRAPRGTTLACRAWQQEGAMRLLMNSLDADVAELTAAGLRRVARDRPSFHAIVEALRVLGNDETLVVESGKLAGVIRSEEAAPRLVILNEAFLKSRPDTRRLDESERFALPMASEVRAASWTDTGPQDALPLAERTLAMAAQKHFAGTLAGRFVVSGGLGAAGGALPLAATLHGAAFLGIEADGEKIKRRVRDGFCGICVNELGEALRILKNAVRKQEAVSVGLIGNCAEILPEFARRGVVPDLLTDQTRVEDYIPIGITPAEAAELRRADPRIYSQRAGESLARHVEAMLELRKLGACVFEFGNGLRAAARERGVTDASEFPGFAEVYLGPMLAGGGGPLRWVALSGEGSDIRRADEMLLELFAGNAVLARYIRQVSERVRLRGLPSRSAWLGRQERALFAPRLNELVAKGELKAPVVIACETQIDPRLAASLREALRATGGDTRPPLDALLQLASGASWVACEVVSQSEESVSCASRAVVADGTPAAAGRIERVFGSKER